MKLFPRYFSIISFAVLTAAGIAAGQPSGNNEPIYLKYADSLVGRNDLGGTVRELNGKVHLIQGDVTVFCDRAIQYLDVNKVELIGSVRILQGTVTLTAPRADYDGNSRLAWGNKGVKIIDRETTLDAQTGYYSTATAIANFYGNVQIIDDSVIIQADTIEYSRRSKNSTANGRVVVHGRYSSTILTGDTVWNIPSTRYTRIVGTPVLRQIDTVVSVRDSLPLRIDSAHKDSSSLRVPTANTPRFDTLTITAALMEAYRNGSERYIATGGTEIVRSGLAARADTVIYEKSVDVLRMRGAAPVVWYDSTQLRADSLLIFLPEKKLRRIEAFGNAFSATHDDTSRAERTQQLTGTYIRISVEHDTLREIFSRGDAKSLYFMLTENEPDGAARNNADSIKVETMGGKPEVVRWLGGVTGEYFPEQFVSGKPATYYLPGFLWIADRPKKKQPLERNQRP